MNANYGFALQDGALVALLTATQRERDELVRILDALAADPGTTGDETQDVENGRTLHMKRFGRWLVTYWSDHGEKEVRITQITKLKAS